MDLLKKVRICPEHFYAVLAPFALIAVFLLATGYTIETGFDYIIEFLVLAIGAVFASEFAYKFSPGDGTGLGIALLVVSLGLMAASVALFEIKGYYVPFGEIVDRALFIILFSAIYGAAMMLIFKAVEDYRKVGKRKTGR